MTPGQMREALAIVDMLDGIDNVRKNTLAYDNAKWFFSSAAGNSAASVRLNKSAAEFVISAVTEKLRAKFAELGGEWGAS